MVAAAAFSPFIRVFSYSLIKLPALSIILPFGAKRRVLPGNLIALIAILSMMLGFGGL